MQILDGKKIAQDIRNEIAEKVKIRKQKGEKIPHLAAVLVGNDPASETYVNHKVKDCEEVGFKSTLRTLPETAEESALLKIVHELNEDDDVDGFIVQLPLPHLMSVQKVINSIRPDKDVDGFHPINTGRMAKNLPAFVAATPNGIMMLLERYQIETAGKHCVVLGRSEIVGSPISILMGRKGCYLMPQCFPRYTGFYPAGRYYYFRLGYSGICEKRNGEGRSDRDRCRNYQGGRSFPQKRLPTKR